MQMYMVLTVTVVLVTRCIADDDGGDLDSIMEQLAKGSTTIDTSPNAEIEKCVTTENQEGECVKFYLCNENNIINTDGSTIIDIRIRDGPCTSYLDLCCLPSDVQDVTQPVSTSGVQRAGCGWRNPNGVGMITIGDVDGEAKFAEFPWMVAVLASQLPIGGASRRHVYVGGGSLIHPSVVLTAAHSIINSSRLHARAGEWDTQTNKEPYPHQDRDVASIVVHRDFNKKNLRNDVALLFLSQPMDLAPNVGLACLPNAAQLPLPGTTCLASGWGKTQFEAKEKYQVILKKVELPLVEQQICQKQLRRTRLGYHFKLHSSFICAGGEDGKDTCIGDGGSPLVCPVPSQNERYVQSGIVSWGIGCGEKDTPGVYANVAGLRAWIDRQVAAAGYDTSVYTL